MTKKQPSDSVLPPDPVGDALAEVYLFLLRKASERKRGMPATARADVVADTFVDEADNTASGALVPDAEQNFASDAT